MRNERVWPQQCWKSCANGSNIVALRFGDHGPKEMLGVVGWKVWPVLNFAQQHATTYNTVCKWTQHVTSNNVGNCWPTMLRPFARGFTLLYNIFDKKGDHNVIPGIRIHTKTLVKEYIKHETQCLITRWNTEKRVENTTCSRVFLTNFEVILLLKQNDFRRRN